MNEVSQNVIVGKYISVFIDIDDTGFSNLDLKSEAAIERVATDMGAIKINGKIGVNSGVDITISPVVQSIGKAISDL